MEATPKSNLTRKSFEAKFKFFKDIWIEIDSANDDSISSAD